MPYMQEVLQMRMQQVLHMHVLHIKVLQMHRATSVAHASVTHLHATKRCTYMKLPLRSSRELAEMVKGSHRPPHAG